MKIKSAVCYCFLSLFVLTSFRSLSDSYTYEDNDCSLQFPAKPKTDTIVKETQLGKLTIFVHVLKNEAGSADDNKIYQLVKTEYPMEELQHPTKKVAEGFFEGTISSSVKGVNGKLISTKDVLVDGNYGKEVIIDYSNDTKRIRMLACIAKSKMYAVATIAATDKSDNPNAKAFFSSFKIK
ncbi:MAG: hypothetical protein QM726_12390 [Chitinophagaceae bacterium]